MGDYSRHSVCAKKREYKVTFDQYTVLYKCQLFLLRVCGQNKGFYSCFGNTQIARETK